MSSIPETTYFVFAEKEIDKKTKMYKQVKKTEASWNFRVRMRRLSPAGSREESAETEKILQEMPMRSLSVKTGDDMENIDKELEKTSLLHTGKKTILISPMWKPSPPNRPRIKYFDMIDAVALHQQKKALDLYYDLLALKEAPMRIFFCFPASFSV